MVKAEAMQRRGLSHSKFPGFLTGYLLLNLQLCEIDLSEILPAGALSPFLDEIKSREKQRKRLARKVCDFCIWRVSCSLVQFA